MSDRFAYSTDEEIYNDEFNSRESAATEGFCCFEDSDVLWIGKIVRPDIKSFVHGESILELIAEAACDDYGEYADSWFDAITARNEKNKELEVIISEWIEKNHPITFYSVDNVLMVTREDHEEDDK